MNLYPISRFLKDVLAAKVILIEFQPRGNNDAFVAEFHPDGLQDELAKHAECAAK